MAPTRTFPPSWLYLGSAGEPGTEVRIGAAVLKVPFFIPLQGTLVALGFAIPVGVIFGVFPARKAAKLRPIEALRYE